ncbi:NUDIX domain-containing protein [Haloferax namakaokahaiae]|uniref:NUDIX domain-containing protein n=1 Tax=Haloferax namakaokahaiae TaxID=1748331 RepID=A0ABD5ZHL9_9EURY
MTPRISARGLVVEKGRLLTTRYESNDERWFLTPGGGQELGETLTETVRREVREETGYEVGVESLAFVRDLVPSNHHGDGDDDNHRVDHFFWCELADDEPTAPTEFDRKQDGVEWLSLDRLPVVSFFPSGLVGPLLARVESGNRDASYLGDVR